MNRHDYRLDERLSPRLRSVFARLRTRNGRGTVRQVWTRGILRKRCRCAVCDRELAPGGEAFRPVTNQENRMDRICLSCLR